MLCLSSSSLVAPPDFTDLAAANLSYANLTGAKLSFANLYRANLSYANLCGADLRAARVSQTIFKNAIYNLQTQFPDENFDPQRYGLKLDKVEDPKSTINQSINKEEKNSFKKEIDYNEQTNNENYNTTAEGSKEHTKVNKNISTEINKQNKKTKINKTTQKESYSRPVLSQEDVSKNQDEAQEIGIKGEFIVNAYLNYLKRNENLSLFEWVSQNDATSPYDFWIVQDLQKILIDVKSTNGPFDNIIHISLAELKKIRSSQDRYDIYRIFEIDEVNKSAKLRVAENLKDFSRDLFSVFSNLPAGVLVDSISVAPSSLNFNNETFIIRY
ncbi:MAG: pentapeptide repeat-containing protein [Snowella sp.]|nr:pentapeptide repeat-containing protein [Snowella sp.]